MAAKALAAVITKARDPVAATKVAKAPVAATRKAKVPAAVTRAAKALAAAIRKATKTPKVNAAKASAAVLYKNVPLA